jgi:ubiquinol-cytochrome c reductase cytochrome b subunit
MVYLHMYRALIYGSYKKPRELIWIFGVLIFLVPDGRGVHGLSAALGSDVLLGRAGHHFCSAPSRHRPGSVLWIRGDYVVSDATLNRFFSLHVIALPLVLLGLVVAHILALHEVGSNNPDGVEIKK